VIEWRRALRPCNPLLLKFRPVRGTPDHDVRVGMVRDDLGMIPQALAVLVVEDVEVAVALSDSQGVVSGSAVAVSLKSRGRVTVLAARRPMRAFL